MMFSKLLPLAVVNLVNCTVCVCWLPDNTKKTQVELLRDIPPPGETHVSDKKDAAACRGVRKAFDSTVHGSAYDRIGFFPTHS